MSWSSLPLQLKLSVWQGQRGRCDAGVEIHRVVEGQIRVEVEKLHGHHGRRPTVDLSRREMAGRVRIREGIPGEVSGPGCMQQPLRNLLLRKFSEVHRTNTCGEWRRRLGQGAAASSVWMAQEGGASSIKGSLRGRTQHPLPLEGLGSRPSEVWSATCMVSQGSREAFVAEETP